ncbi:hypothetical protein NC653_000747 [Populus alba x Populus x berolinensis]|uniref:Uncharacterized protein n=1 Tax=Populus alba x Populus x berolinensis TaxID=444605 RepID=A0AAD6RJG2_9ROSI|nr:hypothetical protein NC653_000747 [Populus alba x Populus x berolinensis]
MLLELLLLDLLLEEVSMTLTSWWLKLVELFWPRGT